MQGSVDQMAEMRFSEACERNKDFILEVLRQAFRDCATVLEVGSGTGQHAVYFAGNLPHLTWHTSDLDSCHDGIRQWLDEAALPNTRGPLPPDLCQTAWTVPDVAAVCSSNTAHITSWPSGGGLVGGVGWLCPS